MHECMLTQCLNWDKTVKKNCITWDTVRFEGKRCNEFINSRCAMQPYYKSNWRDEPITKPRERY